MKTYSIIGVLFLSILFGSCQSNGSEKIIASQDGHTLTQDHFKSYIERLETISGTLSFVEKDNERAKLLDFFYADPQGTLLELQTAPSKGTSKRTPGDTYLESLKQTTNADRPLVDSERLSSHQTSSKSLAKGHQEVRRLLGNDIGEMQFDTPAANTFRKYVRNSLLTTRSSTYNSGYSSSDTSKSTGQIQFCANGTFVEVLSGYISINTDGIGVLTSNNNTMPGYWEAAALPNGMFIILMYSTHSRMLEDSPNGFLPFVVAKHGVDFVQLPSGDLYQRMPNQYCN